MHTLILQVPNECIEWTAYRTRRVQAEQSWQVRGSTKPATAATHTGVGEKKVL